MTAFGSYATWRYSRGFWVGGGPIAQSLELRPPFQKLLLSRLRLTGKRESAFIDRQSATDAFERMLKEESLLGQLPEIKYLGRLSLNQIRHRLQGDGSNWKKRLPFGMLMPVGDARLLPLALSTERKAFSIDLNQDLIVKGDVWCSLYLFRYLVLSLEFMTEWRPRLGLAMLHAARESTHPDTERAPAQFESRFATGSPAEFTGRVIEGIQHSLAGRPCLESSTPWYISATRRVAHESNEIDPPAPERWGALQGNLENFCQKAPLRVFERACQFEEASTFRTLYSAEPVRLPMTQSKTRSRVEFVARIHDLVFAQLSLLSLIQDFAHHGANRLHEVRVGGSARLLFSDEQIMGDRAARLLQIMDVADRVMAKKSRSSMAWQRKVYSAIGSARGLSAARKQAFASMRRFIWSLAATRAARGQMFAAIADIIGKLGQLVPQ